MNTPEKCPDCGSTQILKAKYMKDGDYCKVCGLILKTYNQRQNMPALRNYRKAKAKKAQPALPKKQLKCMFCPATTNLTKHHVIPKRMRKRTKLVVLCRPCHNIADMIANVLYPMEVEINETT